MVVDVIPVEWHKKWRREGWHVLAPGGGPRFHFPKKKLKRVPRQVRHPELPKRFEELIVGTSFRRWWNQTASERTRPGSSEKLFLLRFSDGGWYIPWELLLTDLILTEGDPAPRTSLVRSPNRDGGAHPTHFEEALRTLVILGEDKSATFPHLRLDQETQLVEEAWKQLEGNVKKCVARPIFKEADRGTLPDLLRVKKPHLLIFSGHGTADPEAALLFAGDERVNADSLVTAFQDAGHIPLYAVFWACETGRANAEDNLDIVPALPELCDRLIEAGVHSVLAMQAPIRDVSGRVLAADLFRYFALGYPLERALARARANLMSAPPEGRHPMDWATPVVWAADATSGGKLVWDSQAPRLAHLQVVGRQMLRVPLEAPAQVDSIPTPLDRTRARTWLSGMKTWVQGQPKQAEDLFHWVITLQAIQQASDRYVVAIELDPDKPPAESMQAWAAEVNAWLRSEDLPRRVSTLLDLMQRDPIRAWTHLCRSEGVFIGVSGAPEFDQPSWFWEALRPDDVVVALLGPAPWARAAGWEEDLVGRAMTDEAVEQLIESAPRLARALATLNMPLFRSYMNLTGRNLLGAQAEVGATSLEDWTEGSALLVETLAGPILAATPRRRALQDLSGLERLQAQLDCLEMLGRPTLAQRPKLRQKRLHHLLAAYDLAEHGLSRDEKAELRGFAVDEAEILIEHYRRVDYPLGLLAVSELLGPLTADLPGSTSIYLAWAHVRLGRHDEADYWLRRVPSGSPPLDLAWKHGLLAELFKARGLPDAKAKAYEEIEKAIACCETALRDGQTPAYLARRRLRAYRQDRARILQHLQREFSLASAAYASLIEEWSDDPEAEIDLAIVKRNYSECLRTVARRTNDRQKLQQARDLLDEAHALVSSRPSATSIPVLSEILYEKAKFAEEDGAEDLVFELLEEARIAALESGHRMVAAIAANRTFWLGIDRRSRPFDLEAWRRLEVDLSIFPDHGWAVRTLIDSRTRTARLLEHEGDRDGAVRLLKSNLEDLARNPSFDEGSDRNRIAMTHAGLAVLDEDRSWSEFLEQYKWASDFPSHGARPDPLDFWRSSD